jgi:restriction endonuclease Mrr
MADEKRDDEATEVIEPLPTGETEEELDRIRRSNDMDQLLEREGLVSKHNRGYDEAVRKGPKKG